MKKRIILYGAVLLSLLSYKYGRAIWYPVYLSLSGKANVEETVEELESSYCQIFDVNSLDALNVLALKEERILELWGKERGEWRLLRTYPFTAFSGKLGPKLREGDGQIPEGLYDIEYLNPNSSYHLSMKVSYPNDFDKEMAKNDGRSNLGGDIFIHGKAVTIGCIPIGDEAIEELFYTVSKVGKEKTKVLILPCDFREARRFPEVDGIDWERRLYRKLRFELEHFWK